ncbi:ATP-binding protein [Halobellus limi]|uniref:histidine kinase n=1 Tax=Halobellus limi TaxID=699433 RepID=A0A1H5W5Q4_9EURY|nr:ATP-binding protein [Halobellus limi]QCC46530.1 PAS domain S-box protein [Halobellus limi]SEF94849.1 PAS domain S-box-containing protein [Halobellus limi]
MQIKRAFLVSILVVGIVLSAAVFVGFQEYKDTLYEHEQRGVDHAAEHVGSALETQLSSLRRTVSIAATNPEVADHGSAAQRRALSAFVERSEFSGVSVIAANGTMTNIVSNVSEERRDALVGSDFGDRTYHQRAMNGTTYVSDPVAADSGNHIITVSTPIHRDGRIVGTMNAAFHLSEREFFETVATTLEDGQRLELYARDGTPIYTTGPDGSPEFERDVTVQGTGWTVSVQEGPESVQSTIRTVTFVQAGSIAAVLGILAAFGWRLYRLSIAQLSRLLSGFRRLEDGQYGTEIELHGSEEWREVEVGFNRLSEAIAASRAEQMARQRELQRERDRFEALFQGVPEPVVDVEITDESTILRDANEAFETTFGHAVEAVAGEDINDLIVPDDAGAADEAETIDGEAAAGEQITRQVRREARDGVREFLFRSAPIDAEGDVSRQFGVYVDITDRNAYEDRLREQRDNLDTLNQVLRHDIRNDLQLVTAYADLLAELCEQRDGESDGEERAYLEKISDSAAHAVELTETARNMADVMLTDETERRPMRLRTALESELEGIRSEVDALIVTDGTIPDVTVSANEILGSVFRNLLTNAVQHNDEDVPEVRVSATVDEASGVVRVRVADNGPGIPDDRKEQIFGKGEKGLQSGGTGLGLYLVQTLVDTYGGDVWVEDRAGEDDPNGADDAPGGAVFVVELPLAE